MFERHHEEFHFGKRAPQPQTLPAALAAVQKNIAPELRFLVGATDDELHAATAAAATIRKGATVATEDPIVAFVKTQQRKAQGIDTPTKPPDVLDSDFAKIFGLDRFGSGVSLSPADAAVAKCADDQRRAMVEGYFAKRASTLEKTELATELERLVKGHEHLFDEDDSELAHKAIAALDFDACLKICRAARERNQLAA